MSNLVKDPVCGMQVESHQYAIEYLQMHFAFCSTQCRERFQANPHLYIGLPGQNAPKQEGATGTEFGMGCQNLAMHTAHYQPLLALVKLKGFA